MSDKVPILEIIVVILILSIIINNIYMYFNKSKCMLQTNNVYDVLEIPNFLTDKECDIIIKLSKDKLDTSYIYNGNKDSYNKERISKQTWLSDDTDLIINKISEKVAKLTNTDKNHQELLQIVNYDKDGYFNPHHDACIGTKEFCERMDGWIGPRYITMLIYLNDDFLGGETYFPKINKLVKPEKGKAILFYNIYEDGKVIDESLHAGKPVLHGNKWIANKWIRMPFS